LESQTFYRGAPNSFPVANANAWLLHARCSRSLGFC
jgi:hypothetical protein